MDIDHEDFDGRRSTDVSVLMSLQGAPPMSVQQHGEMERLHVGVTERNTPDIPESVLLPSMLKLPAALAPKQGSGC